MSRRSTEPGPHVEEGDGLVRGRVARRVFGLFVVCALGPLAVFAFYAQKRVTDELESAAQDQLLDSLRLDGANALYRLGIVLDEVERIADTLLRGADTDVVASHSVGFVGVVAEFAGARRVVAGEEIDLPALRRSELECLERTRQAVVFRTSAALGDQVFVILERDRPAGDVVRVVASVEGGSVWGGLDPDESGVVTVFDEGGGLLHGPAEEEDEEVPRSLLFRAWAAEPHASVYEAEGRSEGLLVAHRRFFTKPQFGTNLVFVRHRSLADVLRPIDAFRRVLLLVAFVTLLLVTLASRRLIGRSLAPLARLLEATRRVRDGDLTARVSVHRDDEFDRLAAAFNSMTESLQEGRRQEEEYRREIEVARDDALAAARTQAEIVQNVSHELRTPVTSALAATEILEAYGLDDPSVHGEFVPVVKSQITHLKGLIEGILTFSDVRSNDDWNLVDVDVGASLRDAVDASAPAALERGVTFDVEVAPGLPLVRADAHRCQLAWRALLDNAIKFNAEGGGVRVRARREEGRATVVVEVEDDGEGVRPADREVVFEPFRQSSEDLTTAKPDGTGLGLSIARRIVERLGGTIEVDDAAGGGALFRVRLPGVGGAVDPTVDLAPVVAEAEF